MDAGVKVGKRPRRGLENTIFLNNINSEVDAFAMEVPAGGTSLDGIEQTIVELDE